MTTPITTPEYMLLFRGMDWDRGLSPEEIQNVMSRWIAWFDRLTEQGKARAGQPLTDKGKVISGKKGQTVSDGPFAESKETVAGYILLQADNLDEAVAIAKECPGLDYGISVEVRLVDQQIGLLILNQYGPEMSNVIGSSRSCSQAARTRDDFPQALEPTTARKSPVARIAFARPSSGSAS